MRVLTLVLAVALFLPAAAQEPENPEAAWKQACEEVGRLFQEEPEDTAKLDAAAKKVRELAKTQQQIAAYNQIQVEVSNRIALMQTLTTAFTEGTSAKDGIASGADLDGIQKSWRLVAKSLHNIDWPGKRREQWRDTMLDVIGALKKRAEKATSANPQDWVDAGKALRLAVEVSETGPHAMSLNQDLPALLKDRDAALEKMYFTTKWADALPWTNALDPAAGFTADAWMPTTLDAGTLVLDNASEKDAFFQPEKAASWRDYTVKMEFTLDEGSGLVIQLRRGPRGTALFTYDLAPAIKAGTLKAGERHSIEFSVFGGKARLLLAGNEQGSPRPLVYGPESGGFALKLPAGAKLTIHKLEVRLFYSVE